MFAHNKMLLEVLEALKSLYYYLTHWMWPKCKKCCTREMQALDPREKIFDVDDLDGLNMIFNYYKKKKISSDLFKNS